MAKAITPLDVIAVVQTAINYLDIDLPDEDLSPSNEMGRQDTIEQLKDLLQKLSQVKTFTTSNVKTPAHSVAPAVAKQPHSTTVRPEAPLIESLRSKLKVLLKFSIAELKQQADFWGYLKKHKKQWNSKWNQRFCVLRDGILLYFESDKEMGKGKGYIILGSYKFIIPQNSNGFTFELEACDKSTAYTFQADHKKDIDEWKQHLAKVTDQGYTKEQLNTINTMVKEIGFSFTDEFDIIENDENTEDGGEIYDDVASQPAAHDAYPPPPPPMAGVKFPPGPLPPPIHVLPKPAHVLPVPTPAQLPVKPTPAQIPVIEADDELYGDVARPDELYEDIPAAANSTVTTNTPYLPAHVPAKAATEQFSTSNLYIGVQDFAGVVGSQDLSFRRGDVMYVLDKVDVNWWIAYHLNGKVGLVAKNFLKEAFAV